MRMIVAALTALMLTMGSAWAASDAADEVNWKKKRDENTALGQAQKALDAEDYAGALPHLEKAVADDPKDADAHNLTGFALRKLERYDEAAKAYETALSIEPEHLNALEYQGELFLKLGQIDKARANLEKLDDICWLGCDAYYLLRDAVAAHSATN